MLAGWPPTVVLPTRLGGAAALALLALARGGKRAAPLLLCAANNPARAGAGIYL